MKKIVWVVDDDQSFCEFMDIWIKKHFDVTITTFNTANEFMSAVDNCEYAPSLVLMDVRLKDENGLRLSKKVKKEHSEIPFIHLTSLGGNPIIEEDLIILNKPIDRLALVKEISRYLPERNLEAV